MANSTLSSDTNKLPYHDIITSKHNITYDIIIIILSITNELDSVCSSSGR